MPVFFILMKVRHIFYYNYVEPALKVTVCYCITNHIKY